MWVPKSILQTSSYWRTVLSPALGVQWAATWLSEQPVGKAIPAHNDMGMFILCIAERLIQHFTNHHIRPTLFTSGGRDACTYDMTGTNFQPDDPYIHTGLEAILLDQSPRAVLNTLAYFRHCSARLHERLRLCSHLGVHGKQIRGSTCRQKAKKWKKASEPCLFKVAWLKYRVYKHLLTLKA